MMTMGIAIMTSLLSDMGVIKDAGPRKHTLKKSSCLLLGIHQDTGISVFQKMKKGIQKHCRHKHGPFCI